MKEEEDLVLTNYWLLLLIFKDSSLPINQKVSYHYQKLGNTLLKVIKLQNRCKVGWNEVGVVYEMKFRRVPELLMN